MSDYLKHLLNLEETMKKLGELISFIYCTKMSIAWAAVFFIFAWISWNETTNHYMASIILAFSIVGGIFTVLMIMSMTREVKEVILLRELYSKFITCLRDDPGHGWDPKTKSTFKEFHSLFKRVCSEVSMDALDLPDDVPPKTMKDAQREVLEQRKIKP